jgi:hypothetical protein
LIDKIQGEDETVLLRASPGVLQWQRIVRIVLNSEQFSAEDHPKVEFVKKCFEVLRVVATVYTKKGYRHIESVVIDEVLPQCKGDFTQRDVRMFLSCLVDGNILERIVNPQGTLTYYVFDSSPISSNASSNLAKQLLGGRV